MRKLIYAMNASLDGYIAARGDDIGWSVPSAELHQWFNDRAREIGVSLYGRKLWELMSAHWPTADQQPDAPPVEVEVLAESATDEAGGRVHLRVGDRGGGVSAAVLPRLFERFSAGASGGGTGLGLFIVRELARSHGGDAWYQPAEGDTRGAFVITLPLASATTASTRTN